MKHILIITMLALAACTNTPQIEAPTTTTAPTDAPIAEKDMNVGSIVQVGKVKTWERSSLMDRAPQCPEGAAHSKPCEDFQGQGCKISTGNGLLCREVTTWKVTGYVYEKLDLGVRPLAGAEIYQTWFAGCFAGFCDHWQVAVTDKDGKYEFLTSDLKDTAYAKKAGFYGYCADSLPNKMSLTSGQNLIPGGAPLEKVKPITLNKLTPNACK
jgi:hypothetical protein